jgi:serine/threonine protein kinase
MSVIYLAEDTKLNRREVALKELRLPDGASDEDVREAEAWFARESALLSMLHHPLIPVFYSVFREEGRSYIAQEYVPGENLEDLVKRQGPIEPDLALTWGIALSQLLDYLHSLPEPVIFRDLKPSNVVLRSMWSSPDRRLAVVDFGIARSFSQDVVGTVIGTPGYAPPEQYQGMATPQSDVYALGVTLHRLLTGYDPEQGTPFTFPSVRSLNPSVPAGLAAVVARATALNPSERFASAHDMHEALCQLAPPDVRVPARRRRHTSLFDSTWMAVAAALVGISLLSRIAAFVTTQPSQDWPNSALVGPGTASIPLVVPPAWQCGTNHYFSTLIGQLRGGQSALVVSCSSDGTAWQLDTQSGQLTHYALDGSIGTVADVPVPTLDLDTVTPAASQDAKLGDNVWLTGRATNLVVLYDPSGQFHTYTVDLPGAKSVIPVGSRDGNLLFRTAGNSRTHEITVTGQLDPKLVS